MIIKFVINFIALTFILWGIFEWMRYAFKHGYVNAGTAKVALIAASILGMTSIILFTIVQLF